MTNTSLRVPSTSGIAWNPGQLTTVNCGSNRAIASGSSSRRNIVRAKRLCQASSVMTRIGRR